MKAIVFTVAIICLSQGVLSIDCEKGYYKGTDQYDEEICYKCRKACADCDKQGSCGVWEDGITGVEVAADYSPIFYCMNSFSIITSVGYNPDNGRCDQCIDGCSTCFIDYDLCLSCKGGWEYNPSGRSCHRAETGLGATVLALSIILTALAVFLLATVK